VLFYEKNLVVGVRFYRGFSRILGAERGKNVVKLWWIRGETWFRDDAFSGLEIAPGFRTLFLACAQIDVWHPRSAVRHHR
jgi:hypothetical protein